MYSTESGAFTNYSRGLTSGRASASASLWIAVLIVGPSGLVVGARSCNWNRISSCSLRVRYLREGKIATVFRTRRLTRIDQAQGRGC